MVILLRRKSDRRTQKRLPFYKSITLQTAKSGFEFDGQDKTRNAISARADKWSGVQAIKDLLKNNGQASISTEARSFDATLLLARKQNGLTLVFEAGDSADTYPRHDKHKNDRYDSRYTGSEDDQLIWHGSKRYSLTLGSVSQLGVDFTCLHSDITPQDLSKLWLKRNRFTLRTKEETVTVYGALHRLRKQNRYLKGFLAFDKHFDVGRLKTT